jgi:hypothetical protein
MDQERISAREFKQRLAQLCLTSRSAELPRKQRDRQIILKSVALFLSKRETYTERELNAALMNWTGEVGHSLEVDHAALRRSLIDEKYLERPPGGEQYRLAVPRCANWFAAEVEELDPALALTEAIEEARVKRAQYQNRTVT